MDFETKLEVLRLSVVREHKLSVPVQKVMCADDAASIIRAYIGDADREHFVVLLLNTKHDVTGVHTASIGSLDATIVHPREVFKIAIVGNASAIIVGHNHPSGHENPSDEDINVTRRLGEAGRLLGIDVLDHIVIGEGTRFASLSRHLKG